MSYLSRADYAELLGLSRAAITRAVNEQRIHLTSKGIDPDHPTNQYYAEKILSRKSDSSAINRAATPPPKYEEQTTLPLFDVTGDMSEFVTDQERHMGFMSKSDIERMKLYKQVTLMDIKERKERGELVSRESAQKLLAKLFMVDSKEWRTMGDRLADELAALGGIEDSETIIKFHERIEAEVFKTLQHIKRLINDYITTDLRGELLHDPAQS
jgi:hypothetical protein